MIISPDRQNFLAHLVTDGVYNEDLVDFTDDDQALKAAKRALQDFVRENEEIDLKARAKVASLKRGVSEGTPEWEVMYLKYYEEERGKRGQSKS